MQVERSDQARLLDLARAAIIDSLDAHAHAHAHAHSDSDSDSASHAPAGDCPASLSAHGASFVTLSIAGALRGCCGSIEACRSLADDVWHNAWRTAFEDPRFAPLRAGETRGALLEISVLGPLQRVQVASEQALLTALRPGVDGLLLGYGSQRATFLPKVWQKLPDPQTFVTQLKRKMGVADGFWDDELVVRRYATEEFAGMLLAPPTDAP
jgi:AmmeMemoRadiSam system protein A